MAQQVKKKECLALSCEQTPFPISVRLAFLVSSVIYMLRDRSEILSTSLKQGENPTYLVTDLSTIPLISSLITISSSAELEGAHTKTWAFGTYVLLILTGCATLRRPKTSEMLPSSHGLTVSLDA